MVLLAKEKPCLPSITSKYLFSFRDYSKILVSTNLLDLTENEEYLDIPEYLTYSVSHCNLPNDGIFCYGNSGAVLSGFTFIITSNKAIKILPPGIPCAGSKSVAYKDSVYVFCGFSYLSYPNFRKFDLYKNRWEDNTEPLHRNSIFSCIDFCECILYSDINGCLYLYDIATNSHSIIITLGESKHLFHIDEKAYFVENKAIIYESKAKNPFSWEFLCKIQIDTYKYSKEIVCFGSSIYYKPAKDFIYMFDLNSKTSQRLKIKLKI